MPLTKTQYRNRLKLIAALESGEYTQGGGKLRNKPKRKSAPSSFCCLGVGCDVLAPKGWGNHDGSRTRFSHVFGNDGLDLNTDGLDAFGFTAEDQEMLIARNDGKASEEYYDDATLTWGKTEKIPRHTFVEIAEIIRLMTWRDMLPD